MKKNLCRLAAIVFGLGLSSCYYDPYYTSVGSSYSSGYGDGYGYGGSSFSTSVFVSTGDPRWGYDPNCYSYYDYHTRRYYDPYLHGYYPVGYRPPVVYGVPHPHGWRPGRGYIRGPGYVSGGMIQNYRNRESAYRGTSYGWARQVRSAPNRYQPRVEQRPYGRPDSGRPPGGNYRQDQFGQPGRFQNPGRQGSNSGRSGTRTESRGSYSRYNTPVTAPQFYGRQESGRRVSGDPGRRMSQGDPRGRQQQGGGSRGQSRGGGGGGRGEGRQEEGKSRLR